MAMLNLVTKGGVLYPIPGQCAAPGIPSLESITLHHGVCLVNVTSSATEQELSSHAMPKIRLNSYIYVANFAPAQKIFT